MRGTGNQRGLMGSASAFGLLVDHWDTTGIVGIDEILESEEGVGGPSEIAEDSEVMEICIGGWWEMWKCLGLTLIGGGSDEVLGILWRHWTGAGRSSRVGRSVWRCCRQTGILGRQWETLEVRKMYVGSLRRHWNHWGHL